MSFLQWGEIWQVALYPGRGVDHYEWRRCRTCRTLWISVVADGNQYLAECKGCGAQWPIRCPACNRVGNLGPSPAVDKRGRPLRRVICSCGWANHAWIVSEGARVRRTSIRAKYPYQKDICAHCAVSLTDQTREIHHIVPLEDGGLDVFQNMVVLCRDCHRAAHKALRTARKATRQREDA